MAFTLSSSTLSFSDPPKTAQHQEEIDSLNFKLNQKDRKISMLEDEVHNLTIKLNEVETIKNDLQEREAANKENLNANTKKSPNKKNIHNRNETFMENNTMNLLSSTLANVDHDGSFFDDNLMSVRKKSGAQSHLAINGNFQKHGDGEQTIMLKSLEKEVEFEELKIENEDLQDANQLFEKKNQQLLNELEAIKGNFTSLEETLTKTNHEQALQTDDFEKEIEQLKTDLNKANRKAADFSERERQFTDMESRMEAMEENYVKKKDEVKQGNNLFAEVEDRRNFVEKRAVELKNEVLKVRLQRNELSEELNTQRSKVVKLQKLVNAGVAAGSSGFNSKPLDKYDLRDLLNFKKKYSFYYDEAKKYSDQAESWIERAKAVLNDDSKQFLWDHQQTCNDYYKLNEDYKKLVFTFGEINDDMVKVVKERDEAVYKNHILEYYNSLGKDHKYFKMEHKETSTEDLEDGKAQAGECKQQ